MDTQSYEFPGFSLFVPIIQHGDFAERLFGDLWFAFGYTLTVAPGALVPGLPVDPSDKLGQATPFGALTSTKSATDTLMSSVDDRDVFSFTVDQTRQVTFRVEGLESTVSMNIVADLNNNGVFDNGESIAVAFGSGTIDTSKLLGPGTFFIVIGIFGLGNSTPCTLSVSFA